MTPAQDKLYWREWGAISRRCKAAGLPVPDRHALHVEALGRDASHHSFTNGQFDRVLAVFRAHSRPNDLAAQLRQMEQPKIRLKHRITHAWPEAYWRAIAKDKFGTDDLDVLNEHQLEQLRNTLADREVETHKSETVARRRQRNAFQRAQSDHFFDAARVGDPF